MVLDILRNCQITTQLRLWKIQLDYKPHIGHLLHDLEMLPQSPNSPPIFPIKIGHNSAWE